MAVDITQIREELIEHLGGAKMVSVDGLTREEHDLDSLINALKFLKSEDAQAKKTRPFRYQRFVPPGTV